MQFTTNYKNNERNDYEKLPLLPKGQYEMIITRVKHDATKKGTEYISISMVVRNDLDQALPNTNGKAHNRYYTHFMWPNRATGDFEPGDMQYVFEAAGIPEGTVINSFDELTKQLVNKPVRLKIGVYTPKDGGETRNSTWPNNFDKTKFPQVQHVFKKKQQSQPDVGAGITDDGLPF